MDGNTVSGATVIVSQEEIAGVTQTNVVSALVSDFNGQTEHVLELEAIMNVKAFTLSSSTSSLSFHRCISATRDSNSFLKFSLTFKRA